MIVRVCPACKRFIIWLEISRLNTIGPKVFKVLCYPKGAARAPLAPEVPKPFTYDYLEACAVLVDSPKASAALSRRCLQRLLREEAHVEPGNLADEIQQVLDKGRLPTSLIESLDAIRNIGNFASHPLKSQSSGEVLDVEPGEAEWNLDVLESLFDYYFVQPAVIKKKRDKLNHKLQEAGKPTMK